MENITIKRLSKEQIKDVQYLAKKCLGVNYTIESLEKKYNTKPYSGIEYIGVLAYLNTKPIGFYGAIPMILNKKNKQEILIAQTCDSYTLPKYQGKGVHFRLANASYEIMKKEGVQAVFAFHSENTLRSCEKLGWKVYQKHSSFVMEHLVKLPWLKILSKYSATSFFKKRLIKNVLAKFPQHQNISNELSPFFYSVKYDTLFAAYKNQENCYILTLAESKVWIKIDAVIYVGHIEASKPDNLRDVLNSIRELGKQLKTDKVVFQIQREHPLHKIINENNSIREGYKIGYLNFTDQFDFEGTHLNYCDIDTFI